MTKIQELEDATRSYQTDHTPADTGSDDSNADSREARPPPPVYITVPVPPLKRRLVVLDLNGLLCHIEDNKWFMNHNLQPHGPLGPSKSWIARPYLSEFLNELTKFVDLAIWTSRTTKNLNRLLHEMSTYLPEDFLSKLWLLLDQSHCYPLPQPKASFPLWLKPLNVIQEMSDHKLHNILLVDDSPLKNAMNHPFNAVHPPTFDPQQPHDNYLLASLLPFLKKFAESNHEVTDFVRKHWPQSYDSFHTIATHWGPNLPTILFSQVTDPKESEYLKQQVLTCL